MRKKRKLRERKILLSETSRPLKNIQRGKTLNEMLGVLAIIGVLSFTSIAGLKYAFNKTAANLVLQDVSLAYAVSKTSENKEYNTRYDVQFKPKSGLSMLTERVFIENVESTDIVIVNDVPLNICNILKKMNKTQGLTILDYNADFEEYYFFEDCYEQSNFMAFTLDDINGQKYTCNRECPESSRCSIRSKCLCDEGFYMRDDVCEPTPENFCIYGFGDYSQSIGNFYADCSYELQNVNPGQTLGDYKADCIYEFDFSTDLPSFKANQECASGEYCILNWTDNACAVPLTSEGASKVYGRCAPFESHYDVCLRENELSVPNLVPIDECSTGEYCILNWADSSCEDTIGATGASEIYGRCASFESSFTECKQRNESNMNDLTPRAECKDKKQYCNLQWTDENCTPMQADGADYLFGVCLNFEDNSVSCPSQE